MSRIHPLAHVDASAVLDPSVVVGPFAVIGPGVRIGADCEIRTHAVIDGPGTTLGARNVVHSHAVLGGPPQDKKYHGEDVAAVIGDDNVFREFCTVNRGTPGGGGLTRVGSRGLFLAGAHIAHDCFVGDDVILGNNVLLAGHVVVEERASMSGGSGMHHFGTIGTLAYIGGLTRLVRDAPPFMITEGHPARTVKVNAIGMARAGYSPERIETVRRAFRHVFRRLHATWQESFAALDTAGIASPEVDRLRDYFAKMAAGRHGRAREALRH